MNSDHPTCTAVSAVGSTCRPAVDTGTGTGTGTTANPAKTKKKKKKNRLRAASLRLFGGGGGRAHKLLSSSVSFATTASSSVGGGGEDASAATFFDDCYLGLDAYAYAHGGGDGGGSGNIGGDARCGGGSSSVEIDYHSDLRDEKRRESTEEEDDGDNPRSAAIARDLQEAQDRYDEVAHRHPSSSDVDPEAAASLRRLVRRSRSDLYRATARYLEDDIRASRRRRAASADYSCLGSASVPPPSSAAHLVDLADRLRTLGQLYDEELSEYGDALRCYGEVLRIEDRLLGEVDLLFVDDDATTTATNTKDDKDDENVDNNNGDGDGDGRRRKEEFTRYLSASMQETRLAVGRLRYRVHGSVAVVL